MATLGKTALGASGNGTSANFTFACGPYTASENGTVTDINLYDPIGQTSAFKLTLGIYADSSGSPGARLAQSAEIGWPNSPGWATASISLAITNGSQYWLAFDSNQNFTYLYDHDGAVTLNYKAFTYSAGSLPDPYGTPDGNIPVENGISLYVTYTPAGGGGVTWLPVTRVMQGATFDAIDSGFKPPR